MRKSTRGRITLRTAGAADAQKLYALIQANLEEGHLLPRTPGELVDFFLGQVRDFLIRVHSRTVQKRLGPGPANAENISEADFGSLLGGQIDACNTCHVSCPLP